jgi:hypothetical protein
MSRDDFRNGRMTIKNEIDQIVDDTLGESKGDLIRALNKLALLKHTHRSDPIVSRTVADVEIDVRLTMQDLQKKLSEIKKKK